MTKTEIRLRPCCLECEHFNPELRGFGYCFDNERVITCSHEKVCWKYIAAGDGEKNDAPIEQ